MNLINLLRKVGWAEGVSLLVLLFVAMPLKYVWHRPDAVKYVGWAHGLLFVVFVALLFRAYDKRMWPFKRLAYGLLAAFLPFGTFVFDKELKKESAEQS